MKNIIETYIFKNNRYINVAFSKKSKYKKENMLRVYDYILEQTSFLPDTVSIKERLYCITNNITERVRCSCGKYVRFVKNRYQKYCSVACNGKDVETIEKRKQTCIEKYGCEFSSQSTDIKNRIKKTNVQKYGVENAMQNKEIAKKSQKTKLSLDVACKKEISAKRKKTMKEKYGRESSNPLKIKQTKKNKYGSENYNNREKAKETLLARYGVEHQSQMQTTTDKSKLRKQEIFLDIMAVKKSSLVPLFSKNQLVEYFDRRFLCKDCNTSFQLCDWMTQIDKIRCPYCHPYNASTEEKELINWAKTLNCRIIENSFKVISPLQLDIFFPDNNVAIEYNGSFWHSEGNGKGKNYHLNKTQMCAKKNIQLLHIFDNEWNDLVKRDIWKSVINAKLHRIQTKIYARKCQIKKLNDSKEKNKFLEINHLQGSCASSVNYGLYYENELVSLICFGKSRYNKNYEWEIIRFCNKLETNIVGGFSKLLKHFRENFSGSIISYADKRYSSGNLYKQTGFKELPDSSPNYWYIRGNKILSRISCQKHKLKSFLQEFDPALSESENMALNGWYRIWDCGNKVAVLE